MAKSFISILIVILVLVNEDRRFTALVLQETNKSVDELVLGLKREYDRHGLVKTIIRSGSLPTESSCFNAKKLSTKFKENFYSKEQETMMFIAKRHLYQKAKLVEKSYKRGDK